jgi:hypothetical protein
MSEEGKSKRLPRAVEVRKVGPSGSYWYAVLRESELPRGRIAEVRFWGDSIAVYRGEDDVVRAVENRCAHRQLPLTAGVVQGERIACQYHGWSYDGCGRCVAISHELGKNRTRLPKIKIRHYPVKVRYGLVWLFPGDPEQAEQVPLPEIPQLLGPKPWPVVPIEVTIASHFTMIVENVCDFNHAYLHRHKQPFTQPVLRSYERRGNTIEVLYDTSFHDSPISRLLADQRGLDQIKLWYQYPYQGSDIAGKYLHWLFMLPEDERTTRCFFLFLFGPIRIPGTQLTIPSALKRPILELANLLYIKPLLAEDKLALEQEQVGFDRNQDKPFYELNPIVPEFQAMSIELWQAWREQARGLERRGSHRSGGEVDEAAGAAE